MKGPKHKFVLLPAGGADVLIFEHFANFNMSCQVKLNVFVKRMSNIKILESFEEIMQIISAFSLLWVYVTTYRFNKLSVCVFFFSRRLNFSYLFAMFLKNYKENKDTLQVDCIFLEHFFLKLMAEMTEIMWKSKSIKKTLLVKIHCDSICSTGCRTAVKNI